MGVLREVIGRGATSQAMLEVVSGHHEHAGILRIPVESVITEPKEVGVSDAVVLQDYCFVDAGEHPVQPACHTEFQALIFLGIVPVHFAWPIDLVHQPAH
jgi:hypothetical protein